MGRLSYCYCNANILPVVVRYSEDEIHFNLMAVTSDRIIKYQQQLDEITGQTGVSSFSQNYCLVRFHSQMFSTVFQIQNKFVATMAIRPLNDHTYCARAAFTHLGLWRKLYDYSLHHLTVSRYLNMCSFLRHFH